MNHRFYMDLAIDEAWKYQGLTLPNPAVGAVVVDRHEKILSISAHKRAGEPHAEVNAIKEAYLTLTNDTNIEQLHSSDAIHNYLIEKHHNLFHECSIYVTLEPCNHYGSTPPCALLIERLGFQRVIIAHPDESEKASGGTKRLRFEGIEVIEGIQRERAAILLEPFLIMKQKPFTLFKWASHMSGSIEGKIVSSFESRQNVHAMRDVMELLVIGGNTVRHDRPTLDARLVDGRAPDVLIYSQREKFDQDIPLFNVLDRKVMIQNSLAPIDNYKSVLIEGGPSMFKEVARDVDWLLLYLAPTFLSGVSMVDETLALEIIHVEKSGDDQKVWMRKKNG
jgi:diaminohydroxyphosphoribosylaminopyrimidine deaminase/5-amino-6-(5-phosphoribosylamino)uracil reductase